MSRVVEIRLSGAAIEYEIDFIQQSTVSRSHASDELWSLF